MVVVLEGLVEEDKGMLEKEAEHVVEMEEWQEGL